MRFDVDWLILSGLFLGRPVICDPFCDTRASYVSFPGYSTAPLSEKETENNPLSSLAVSPEASLPRAKPPSPEEPPPSRGPYSCIPRRCPLREPLPLRSRSPFLSVPVAAPPSPFPPHTFLRYVPLGSVLIVPSPCFCDSCSCCSSFCLCNFS